MDKFLTDRLPPNFKMADRRVFRRRCPECLGLSMGSSDCNECGARWVGDAETTIIPNGVLWVLDL